MLFVGLTLGRTVQAAGANPSPPKLMFRRNVILAIAAVIFSAGCRSKVPRTEREKTRQRGDLIAMELEHYKEKYGKLPREIEELFRKYEEGNITGPNLRGKYQGWELDLGEGSQVIARKVIKEGNDVIVFEIDASFHLSEREQ